MAATTPEQIDQVRAIVAAIPPGKVTTYGDIAEAVGLATPRTVGWIMRTDTADLPWHRVISASGRPSAPRAELQLRLLKAEGAPIIDGRVVMRTARTQLG
ncbi:MGMT family protein [Nocardia camponoti]|uniref:DNA methyltransferase n=1 Tax=Nocardia camponoti TaxID=1616106 RepID=A0A917V722_9NOCA|nr:MGMT family protein [Nocardia camponoti]GGK45361.1 DNA methyltransferase [Nocardia camponoti]